MLWRVSRRQILPHRCSASSDVNREILALGFLVNERCRTMNGFRYSNGIVMAIPPITSFN